MEKICSFFWFKELEGPMYDLTSEDLGADVPESVEKELMSKADAQRDDGYELALAHHRVTTAIAHVL